MMCKLLYFVQSLNYICSVVILTIISLERYLAINHPMLNRRFARTGTVRGVLATVVWSISVLYSLPHLITYDTTHVQRLPTTASDNTTSAAVVVDSDVFCYNTHPNVTRVYVFINFAALYVTPLTLMTFVYARISIELWQSGSPSAAAAMVSGSRLSMEAQRTRTPRGGSLRNPSYLGHTSAAGAAQPSPCSAPPFGIVRWASASAMLNRASPTVIEDAPAAAADAGDHEDSIVLERSPRRRDVERPATVTVFTQNNPLRSRRKVIRLLIAFVVSFAVCMLPNHVWLLWQQWADFNLYSYEQYARHMYVPPVMTLLFYVNSCLNPFLYALISDKFRSAVSESECLRRCCRRSDDIRCVAKIVPPAPPCEDSL